ncbi:IgGFc-binding protein-like [Protopterus annectens]|uniref:IgGFc-binding protein-like n=1 Tax=Protopterus annectens TaxID=7888 RepID=UPI001CFBA60D|nr:IgGFc-binding protein-like [Protopterus annectens]
MKRRTVAACDRSNTTAACMGDIKDVRAMICQSAKVRKVSPPLVLLLVDTTVPASIAKLPEVDGAGTADGVEVTVAGWDPDVRGSSGGGCGGSTAVDTCAKAAKYLTKCDFNNNYQPFCDWVQPCDGDDGDWIRTKHATPTPETGPIGDYPGGNGYFIYQEASNFIPLGTNRLESPSLGVLGDICIEFWYHMLGSENHNKLKVIIKDNATEAVIWSRTGNQSSFWLNASVPVTISVEKHIKVIFEAVRGWTEYGDTAVDNVAVQKGPCESTCSVHSDPHYRTFDGQPHTFMGTCTYTLSKLCDVNSTLPYFNVEAANENRGGNTHVSYVKSVTVDVYSYRIILEKNKVVKVNGIAQLIPLPLTPDVTITQSGQYAMVMTSFGLRVKYDGNQRAEVTLPSTFQGKVCGMCGNYNSIRNDDFLNPDGKPEPDSVSLGNSWQVYNDTSCTPGHVHNPNCTVSEQQIIESNSYCGIITDTNGPFRQCHSVIDPKDYFDDCAYDLCELNMDTGALCSNLQAYADACQSEGVTIRPWRNETFCATSCITSFKTVRESKTQFTSGCHLCGTVLPCKPNTHYQQCGPACPATCTNPNAPSSCSLPCVEDCVCDSGYLLYHDRCVPSTQCGCWQDGKHYPVGSEFWTDDSCSTKCSCPSRGSQLVCVNASCPKDHYCGINNGVPGCYPHTYGICRVHNDPHYNTFDKETHHFMGTCTYTVAKVCANTTSLPYFNIETKNEHRGNPSVSYVQKVHVDVYGHRVSIIKKEPSRVLVDGVWQKLSVSLADGALLVRQSGRYVQLETDFGLSVSYDTDHSVEVKVPSTYFNLTCGMCGNFNNLRKDDFMMPNGTQAKNSNDLGNSWKVNNNDTDCQDPGKPPACPEQSKNLYEGNDYCGIITKADGHFAVCHSVVNPSSFFDSCVFDLCALNGDRQRLCNALETYAHACQSAGVSIPPWRNETFCPLKCPSNSHYNVCGSACPATCTDMSAPNNCSKPCVEGCHCDHEFVLSGQTCVSVHDCGCVHNGKYHEKGHTFWEENCEHKCTCYGNNHLNCTAAKCESNEICKVQNGEWGCHVANAAMCHIYGDPHYITFDGKLYHFQGACNYSVTQTCRNSAVNFSVTSRNEHRGSPKWSALNSVAFTISGLHIILKKNNKVSVNGVNISLPYNNGHGILVSKDGPYLVLQTHFGLKLKYNGDHELFVHVNENFKGQLCGLCGTYNDDQLDDFTRPDGVLALDSNEFGNSWQVTDNDWICDPLAPDSPSCLPSQEPEATLQCQIIMASNGPFGSCHWYIPPQLYFESCVFDFCATNGSLEYFCSALESYATACAAAGVHVGDWKKETFCDIDVCSLECDFDIDYCGWAQSSSDSFDWLRYKGPTPSLNTGPPYDHTSAEEEVDGYYVYIEGDFAKPGDVAHLLSPSCPAYGPHCFRFWYHMYGVAQNMALKLYLVQKGVPVLMWSQTGNQGNKWRLVEVELQLRGSFQIIIEGVRGSDYRSDVAVDDITFKAGCCAGCTPDSTTTPKTTTSTITTTTPVGETEAICSVHSDPHYHTFDGLAHTYMGNCSHLLSTICANSTLPYYEVAAANEFRGGNTHVSYVKSVSIDVNSYSIVLDKGKVVKDARSHMEIQNMPENHKLKKTKPERRKCECSSEVNGKVQQLPVTLKSDINITFSGQYVMVSTDFGLRVKYDGNHRVEVTLPSKFKGNVFGMCGNYDGNKTDDLLNCEGKMEKDSFTLSSSWDIYNVTSCFPDTGYTPNCTEADKQKIQSNSYCGIITDTNGPFKQCHSVIDPKDYFNDCAYDLCALNMDTGALCSNLQAYADACQSKGVTIEPWRNQTFCGFLCKPKSHYKQCGPACPATCANPNAPSSCSLPCVEGCICDSGYMLYHDQCVPSTQCGCWQDGKHYPVGSEFWTDDSCSTKCRCPSAGSKLECSTASCPKDHYCGIENGVPGCYPFTYGICRVWGDPHYSTFDKETHHFMGICTYTWAKLCTNATSLPYFNVEAKNEHRGNPSVSYIQKIHVDVYGHRVTMVKNQRTLLHLGSYMVDNIWRTLPVTLVGGAVTVKRSGSYVLLETDFLLSVYYDSDHTADVKVPSTYFNQTCGICGNYNNLRADDFMKPDGSQAADSTELGNSWKVSDGDPNCKDPPPPKLCPPDVEDKYESSSYCGLITSKEGPFANCLHVVGPDSFFESCVFDLCALNGSQTALCDSLQSYADACQKAGVIVPPWRNSTFCSKPCTMPNSHYEPCSSACPATCLDQFAPHNCSKPCVEACECDSGFVLSGNTCVNVADCGCWYQGKYYEKHEDTMTENCEQQCQCSGNNDMNCTPTSCEPDKICKVEDGTLGCFVPDTVVCHIYGDPHYITFDGKLYHFQGSCNYTVTETCGNTSDHFTVTTRNEHRGNPTWTAINSVALTVNGVHIALRKNRIVYVNDILVTLPTSPIPDVTISLSGAYVLVQTSFGLHLRFSGDHELLVNVTERYKGELCGLCGTYTGKQQDDFMRPDGAVVQDVNDFGMSWMVKDNEWNCSADPPPPPEPCPPSLEQAAAEHCKIVLDSNGPFAECHWHIPPQLYFDSCVYDQCATNGSSEQLCNALESYVAACEEAGVDLGDWRKDTVCDTDICHLGCDFDTDFCEWEQSTTDSFDWQRNRGPTPSLNTGPPYDHTSADGYYIYIEGDLAKPGDVAHLLSPSCPAYGPHCFRFWYHMYGVAQNMALKVYLVEKGSPFLKWVQTGNQGNKWRPVEVDLQLKGNFQIIIEGVRGSDYRSDVAVDDVTFNAGCCSGCDHTTTSSTTTTQSITSGPPVEKASTCSVHSDPHYRTFDGQPHTFMGTCTYTLSKLCDVNSSLPYFNVEAANENRGGNTHVSYVKSVTVDVYSYRIILEKSKVVKVNGQVQLFPLTLSPGVNIIISGQYVMLTSDFGLRVKYDGNHRAEITLPSKFEGHVCGICGNYNGNKADDFLNPDGGMEKDSNSLGNSWQVYNDTSCTPGHDYNPNCTEAEKQKIESNSYCGIITDTNGPFKQCHSVIDPKDYFDDCAYDLCELNMDSGALCSNLQAYADACQSKGVIIHPWRNQTFCPLPCKPNSHYEHCGHACPATCANPNSPSSCSLPCVEGCICNSGYMLYHDQCVPSTQCGCWQDGKHYPVGSEFWTDDSCSTKCRCPSAGSKLECFPASCPTGHYCGIKNGVPGCYPFTYGICRVWGDPHYSTFDKETHHFMGICTYTWAKLCTNATSLPYFNVEAKNEHRGNPSVSYIQKIHVDVYGHRVTMVKRETSRVLVDNTWRTLPVTLVGGAVTVKRSGNYVLLETDFLLSVYYDSDHTAEVKVPSTYFNQTCGICGNYNKLRADDFMKPDGSQAANSTDLGNSWKVSDGDPNCKDPEPPEPCLPEVEDKYESSSYCGLITSKEGPFANCLHVVSPNSFFESCVFDLCALNGSQDTLCDSLQSYADACQKAGVIIPPWKNSTFCPKPCPDNSHYEPCSSACPATCLDQFAPHNCSKPCVEACECDTGFVLSGSTCVNVADCGCWYQGKYYEKHEDTMTENCEQQCQCSGNNDMNCTPTSCEPDKICKVEDGTLGCFVPDTVVCHIYGDPHYITFDGKLYHFQGSCNYTVTETCGNTSDHFTVTTRNEHRGNPTWTAINSVALTVNGVHIALRKNRIVYVNDILVTLPTSPIPDVTISLSGAYVLVQTSFGLRLQFSGDHELLVNVTERYKGKLCGLCGTYTGKQQDDFMRPDGVVVQDVNDFGMSWMVKDNEWECSAIPPLPPDPCHPSLEQAAEEHCRIVLDSNGPFVNCHWHIPPQLYFDSCVYDQCATNGSSEQLCNALESYAAACEEAGVDLGDWRKDTVCDPDICHLGCDFDTDFCEWEQSTTDSFDWQRNSGPTPSLNTGPPYDHTSADGYYIYIEGDLAKPGDVAHLLSPSCPAYGPHCFRFWYHMYGVAQNMALKVYLVEKGAAFLKWVQTGNQGNKWRPVEVDLQLKGNFQIIIEGVRGSDYRSDVAVDDVTFSAGCCSGCIATTTSSITTTTTTTTQTTTQRTASPPPLESICSVHSDPHYHTFDGQPHTFMGTCTYTLSKLCDVISTLPYFNVEAANEHRGGNTHVSYVKSVTVDVYSHRIILEKNKVVKINGQVQLLPLTLSPGVNIIISGQYVMLTSDFGLRVKYDGNQRAEITLPSKFEGHVCGICGNYNGNKADDFLNPDGGMEEDSNSLGNSWQVYNDTSCTPGHDYNPNCTEAEKQKIESNSYCGIITDTNGPFKQCHSVIDPKDYFDDCAYDLCELNMDSGALCSNLQAYADACQSKGVTIETWRNQTFCPLPCKPNSHYEQCGSACPATCMNPNAPSTCSLPCVESCVCDSGYMLYHDRCVPNTQCGCWEDGKHYPVGSEFWTDDSCSTKCSCPSRGGQLACVNASCPKDHYCGINNGVPGCYPFTYGICRVWGDPHYSTFDKETHHFMGNCTYTWAKLCTNATSLPYFNVEAKNEHRGNPSVSYIQKIHVDVYGHRVTMVKKEASRVLIDDIWTNLPASLVKGAVTVDRSGSYVLLETDFLLSVYYDSDHTAEVKVPSTYFNQTCGICGNYNNLRADDFMKPDGSQAADSTELGNSWIVSDGDPNCRVPKPPKPCLPEDEDKYESSSYCGLITSKEGPFANCLHVVSPNSFFDSCVFDLCALNGSQDALCDSLQSYAVACQKAGVIIPPWRNSTFCPKPCTMPNSHYEPCSSACPATCLDQFAPLNCSKPCVEACECDSGFVLSGSTCVNVADCGCWYQGKYYEKNEITMTENCEQQCKCLGNNDMHCTPTSCEPDKICKVKDGVLDCVVPDTAVCDIYGDPHYITFDGKLYHFQGSCNYTVTETCGNTSNYFTITTRNEHRGNPSWTAINSVALNVNGVHIVLRKNKIVYVNGIPVTLPTSPMPGVAISLNGAYVLVQTNFGLHLKFNGDQKLLVNVTERYKGQLCGLCGTYNGDQKDDFMRPDGGVVQDVNVFGMSWVVQDDGWKCSEDPPLPPKPCPPFLEQAATEHCRIVSDSNGPFAKCHGHISPELYFVSCVYDQCATNGSSEQLCNALESYAATCEEAGVDLGDWRKDTVCDILTSTKVPSSLQSTTIPAIITSETGKITTTPDIAVTSDDNIINTPHITSVTLQTSTHAESSSTSSPSVETKTTTEAPVTDIFTSGTSPSTSPSTSIPPIITSGIGKTTAMPDIETTSVDNVINTPHITSVTLQTSTHAASPSTSSPSGETKTTTKAPVTDIFTSATSPSTSPSTSIPPVITSGIGKTTAKPDIETTSADNVINTPHITSVTLQTSTHAASPSTSSPSGETKTTTKAPVTDIFTSATSPSTSPSTSIPPIITSGIGKTTAKPDIETTSADNIINTPHITLVTLQTSTHAPSPSTSPSGETKTTTKAPVTDIFTSATSPSTSSSTSIPPIITSGIGKTTAKPDIETTSADNIINTPHITLVTLQTSTHAPSPSTSPSGETKTTTKAPVTDIFTSATSPSTSPSTSIPPIITSGIGKTTAMPGIETTSADNIINTPHITSVTLQTSTHAASPSTSSPSGETKTTTKEPVTDIFTSATSPSTSPSTSIPPIITSGIGKTTAMPDIETTSADNIINTPHITSVTLQTSTHAASPSASSQSGETKTTTKAPVTDIFTSATSPSISPSTSIPPIITSGIGKTTAKPDIETTSADNVINTPHITSVTLQTSTHAASPSTSSQSGETKTTTKAPVTDHHVCTASGDPHYNTFDGRVHHFMGNCTYVLTKLCNESSGLPLFEVTTTNEHRGSNTKVSYVNSVHVNVYGNSISLLKNKKVNVNGKRVNPPYSIKDQIKVYFSGNYLYLETDFRLVVRFDGNHYVDVSVSRNFNGLLCGMCGNSNGNPKDDIIKPDGTFAANSNELGESWTVNSTDKICSNGEDTNICNPPVGSEAVKNTNCGMIKDPTGVFKDCHAVIPPENFFENCVIDFCASSGDSVSLCYALQSYASMCAEAGICVAWRNSTFCPISCPAGSHYENCATGCPATCANTSPPSSCNASPAEGCICDDGYILSGNKCVQQSDCGCVDGDNNYYTVGESWYSYDNCTERCTCNSNNNITCQQWECGLLESCKIQDGVLGCYSASKASCHVAGDPHYFTFDKVMHTFIGTCTYVLVQVCDKSNVIDLKVSGKNEQRGLPFSSYLKEVYIDVYNTRITIQRSKALLLNGGRVHTPVENQIRGITINTNGIYTIVETDFGMMVKFDGNHHLEISLPDSYFSKVCGLCGNYNMKKDDEFLMPSGQMASNVSQFGNSWKIQSESEPSCLPDNREDFGPPCARVDEQVIKAQCNVLLSNAFVPCHSLVDPDLFIESCVYDMCKYDGKQSTLCDIVQAYVDICKNEGVTIHWRNSTFCVIKYCEHGSICALKNNGKYACKPTGFGKCAITGDPHYLTFDGLSHHFQGKYTYITAASLTDIPNTLQEFSIQGKNEPMQTNNKITYLKEISTHVYGHVVQFKQKKNVVLDGEKIKPPAQPHDGLRIFQKATRVYLETDFGLSVSFDGSENADITLPNTYKAKVGGLCGNFDGKYKNDFTKPDGTQVKDVNDFGESWRVQKSGTQRRKRAVTPLEDFNSEELNTGFETACSLTHMNLINGTDYCGSLINPKGPFRACHNVFPPDAYLENCLYDLCAAFDNIALLCTNLEQYALTCQSEGVTLENWRKGTICEMTCPLNSKYDMCTSACPATCGDLTAPSECDLPCLEGCECLPGYVMSGFDCVPYKECGCMYENKYYEVGEHFITEDCSQSCVCTESSSVSCEKNQCKLEELCATSNFVRGCYRGKSYIRHPNTSMKNNKRNA